MAEIITKQNVEQLYAASRYSISQEVGGLLYAILLMPQLSPTSPRPGLEKVACTISLSILALGHLLHCLEAILGGQAPQRQTSHQRN